MDEESSFLLYDAFYRAKGLSSHHIDSYDYFVSELLRKLVEENGHLEIKNAEGTVVQTITFYDSWLGKPTLKDDQKGFLCTPWECSMRRATYDGPWLVSCRVENKITKKIKLEERIPVCSIPIMLKSSKCHLSGGCRDPLFMMEMNECPNEEGGYFIIDGNQKMVVTQERSTFNQAYLFAGKIKDSFEYYCEMRSSAKVGMGTTTTQVGWYKGTISVILKPIILDAKCMIPLGFVFKALGVVREDHILHYCGILGDKVMTDVLVPTLESTCHIKCREDAANYINSKRADCINASDLRTDMFPSIKGLEHKRYYLGYMVRRVLEAKLKRAKPDDRDHAANKRIDGTGLLMHNLMYGLWRKLVGKLLNGFGKNPERELDVTKAVADANIGKKLMACFRTGDWNLSIKNNKKIGLSSNMERFNPICTLSGLRKIASPIGEEGNVLLPRRVHESFLGYKCGLETPEGKRAGLLNFLALACILAMGFDDDVIFRILGFFDGVDLECTTDVPEDLPAEVRWNKEWWESRRTRIFVNGAFAGFCSDGLDIYRQLKKLKLHGQLGDASFVYLAEKNQLCIWCDNGRMRRPLLRMKNGRLVLRREHLEKLRRGEWTWNDFVERGIVEYMDPAEVERCNVIDHGIRLKDMEMSVRKMFTHCEIHPALIFGSGVGIVPFGNRNQSPRLTYQGAMGKQAVGVPGLNFKYTIINQHVLHYPQRAMASSKIDEYVGISDLPTGQVVVVAVIPGFGFNQEDSIVLNLSSVQRGLFRSTHITQYCHELKKEKGQTFEIPKSEECEALSGKSGVRRFKRKDGYFYGRPKDAEKSSKREDKLAFRTEEPGFAYEEPSTSHLDENGIVRKGEIVRKGDILIGVTRRFKEPNSNGKFKHDISIVYNEDDIGIVDEVITLPSNAGYPMVRVIVCSVRIPDLGDKFASKHAQKGTCGMLLPQVDMPFSPAAGICSKGEKCPNRRLHGGRSASCPDLIINPLAFPSRMTIGQLVEMVFGKVESLSGDRRSGTPFGEMTNEEICSYLKDHGFQAEGKERLFDGVSGKMYESMVFVGVCYYQRLKHMVRDKMHARNVGKNMGLTRQPAEGRAKGGGLKNGEMERDCLNANGVSNIVKDRMFDCSDRYHVHVCRGCGLIISGAKNRMSCNSCETSEVDLVPLPYAAKLVFQELISINVVPRLITSNKPSM